MLIPKASHLVERVAEKLLRSGALDDSAAQLLRQPSADPAGDAAVGEVANGVAALTEAREEPSRRSVAVRGARRIWSCPDLPWRVRP